MSRLPFVVRVALGAVSLAAEKGQEIVTGAVSAPLTLGSKSAQAFIAVQQDLADLAVRGDRAIETVFPAKEEEQAAWATFDDDEDVDVDLPAPARAAYGEVRPASEPAAPAAEQPTAAEQPAATEPAGTPAAAPAPTAEHPGTEPAGAEQAPSGAGRYALYSSPAPAPSGTASTWPAGASTRTSPRTRTPRPNWTSPRTTKRLHATRDGTPRAKRSWKRSMWA